MPSVGNKNKGNEKWIKHVQAYRKKNRHLTWIQAMQAASSTYHKKKNKETYSEKTAEKKEKIHCHKRVGIRRCQQKNYRFNDVAS